MRRNEAVAPTLQQVEAVAEAASDRSRVSGLTHDFYRYPARFSPRFANAAIEQFTEPGDLVVDPFMGGGTAIVEARARGRRAIGADTSSLALFVARSKTTPLTAKQFGAVTEWVERQAQYIRTANPAPRLSDWAVRGYQRNLGGRSSWRIRKFLEIALDDIDSLGAPVERRFARAVLLRTAQWAVDTRHRPRSLPSFRERLLLNLQVMTDGLQAFRAERDGADREARIRGRRLRLFHHGAEELGASQSGDSFPAARLVLTSPPYPGVHVLYHRWQTEGGKETPVPFWIAGVRDGASGATYTLADRHDLDGYFHRHEAAFRSLASLCDARTVIVQLIAFSDPEEQLDRYLDSMESAGFREVKPVGARVTPRYWREVPSRKWYSQLQGSTPASRELVLFHQLG